MISDLMLHAVYLQMRKKQQRISYLRIYINKQRKNLKTINKKLIKKKNELKPNSETSKTKRKLH